MSRTVWQWWDQRHQAAPEVVITLAHEHDDTPSELRPLMRGGLPKGITTVQQVLDRSGRRWVLCPPEAEPPQVRQTWFRAGALARQTGCGEAVLSLYGVDQRYVAWAIEGFRAGAYTFSQYRRGSPPVVWVACSAKMRDEVLEALQIADAQDFVRDLVNLAPNHKPPAKLAAIYQAEISQAVDWEVLQEPELRQHGMGGILAVGQGSQHAPMLLVGRYVGAPGKPWLALIGKGVTFDSGGVSLKNREGMGRLKADMAGSAVVIGVLQLAAIQHYPVNVMALTPLAENMPDGNAYRPGDVLTMADGTTVEIVSTDAEGRLLLADAVTWAIHRGAAAIIDIATLTGSNVVVLGGIRASLVANDTSWAHTIAEAAETAGEPVWELPHDPDYQKLLESEVAQLKNSAGRPASTITGGLFIGHFAKGVPWAHIDIAGMALKEETGATGYGVALLWEVVKRWAHST